MSTCLYKEIESQVYPEEHQSNSGAYISRHLEWWLSNMHDRISIDPKVCHGQACIKGSRIPVSQIVGMLANGDTIDSMLQAYPTIKRADILACLEYAATWRGYGERNDH